MTFFRPFSFFIGVFSPFQWTYSPVQIGLIPDFSPAQIGLLPDFSPTQIGLLSDLAKYK